MRGARLVAWAVVAGLVPAAPSVARAEPLVLPPYSVWAVDYAEDSCALRRQFGGAEGSVVLEIRQFSPGSTDLQYKLQSERFHLDNRERATGVVVRYHPDAEFNNAGVAFNLVPNGSWRGITFTSSLFAGQLSEFYARSGEDYDDEERNALIASFDQPARAREITAIEVRNAFDDDLLLQTGSLFAPMNAMRECMDELLGHWGIDAEAHRSLRQQVRPLDQPSWARRVQRVYPLANRGEQAILRIRLDVSTDGRATGCHMQQRFGEEQFERAACEILVEHARFMPALDAQGSPIASFYTMTIIYSFG